MTWKALRAAIRKTPLVWHFYEYFAFPGDCYGSFRGVYRSFAEALRAAPPTKTIGYDDRALAETYAEALDREKKLGRIYSYDYPVLFWLQTILTANCRVFDFGGNVGTHYFLYRRYLQFPAGLRWRVCEVASIAQAGEALAAKRGATDLSFTSAFEEADDADILLASGSAQYIESFSMGIGTLNNRPRHLLINRVPLYDGDPFITLQNGGQVFYPGHVFNRKEFIHSLTSLGYELRDAWKDHIDRCNIPFHPNRCLPFYCGLYFQLRS